MASSPPESLVELPPVQDESDYPTPPPNKKSVPFGVLVSLFVKLQNVKKPEKRRKALMSWFNHWREEVGYNLYPVLRLLLPQKDRERAVYGLKEKNLAKTYIKLIPLGNKDPDAIRLLNWKRPTEKQKSSGDFPLVLFEVISKRSSVIEGSLTIDDVNEILDELCKEMGKQEVQSKLLQRVYNKATPEEQRWMARIILKDMNIYVKETTIFSVFHPDAHDLFNTCSDLKKVAYELWDPVRRLKEEDKSIQLFRAFAPMLCKRPAAKFEDTIKDMEGRAFIMEEKLDGERMQLHKRGNEYFYCSRKGKDYTYLYGSHVGTGSLTPYIAKAFDERVEELILDGEMLVWDPVSERNLPFGSLKTAALDKSKSKLNPRPCFKIFDLLYLNGMPLIHKSVVFRKRNLCACVKEIKGRMEFIEEYEGKTISDVRKCLERVMEARGEGLILKHPKSVYVLNGRNKDWVKVKPEYMDNMGETVDVLVIGGNYGTGSRSGGVSTLICGVIDDRGGGGGGGGDDESNDVETRYSSLVRIGSGLTFADYVWVRQKPWKEFDKKNMPSWYQASKRGISDKGDVYLEPEDSFILKVKAAEITPSDQYHIGFTMRFPRALSIRDDLSIADCMTVTAVLERVKDERKRKIEDQNENVKKKRRTATKATVMPEYSGPSLGALAVRSDLFAGLTFKVVSDPRSRDGDKEKNEIMTLIHTHGGKCVQIVRDKPVLVIYGGKTTPYDLKLITNKDSHDVVKPQWVRDCIAKEVLVPLRKKYIFFATTDRLLDRDYYLDDDEGSSIPDAGKQAGEREPQSISPRSITLHEQEQKNTTDSDTEPEDDDGAQDDGEMTKWFNSQETSLHKADKGKGKSVPEMDSETDPDSDYEEAKIEDEDGGEQTLDEFEEITVEEIADVKVEDCTQPLIAANDAKMGEDDEAMEYDSELLFKHLAFYLDTPDNARKNGMEVKSKHADNIATAFLDVEDAIASKGGRIVDMDDPKLTHIIIDKRDISRRKELSRRTSTPKRRNMVVSDFIHACVEENTLLNEEAFVP